MRKHTKILVEWISFSFLGLLLVISSGLFFYQITYAGKIYRNVYVSNINLEGKTKKQAESLLQKKFENILNQEFIVKTDSGEVKTKVADTGLSLDTDQLVNDSYEVGRSSSFLKQLLTSTETIWQKKLVQIEPNIDQAKLDSFNKIAIAQLNIEPQNATLEIRNGQIVTVPEKNGTTVDTSDLTEQIMSLAEDSAAKTITLKTKPAAPAIKVSDFSEAKTYAEHILDKRITLSYGTSVYTPSKAEIGLWIAFVNKDGKYYGTLNNNNIQAYLNKIARDFEIAKVDKKINAADNAVLDPGKEGLYLNKDDALAQIKSQLGGMTETTIALKTYAVAPSEVKVFPNVGVVPGRFEGKYVDVDLTNQKLCRVEGPNIIDCYTISSGKPGMSTPTGTFNITGKNPRQWSGKYGLWMPFWQQFRGDYGLHQLPEWPNGYKEGENHLGTPVSHGCVRLGTGAAEVVYNWTEIGTPVYIHK